MPWKRAPLTTIRDRIVADLMTARGATGTPLKRSVDDVLARSIVGVAHDLHGHIAHHGKQILPDSAEKAVLARHAGIHAIDRKPATFAGGNVTFTGADGGAVPVGTLVQRSDGVDYVTQAAAVVAGGSAVVAVEAVSVGVAANAAEGVALSLVSPIDDVDSAITVAAGGLTGGAEEEDDESLLERLLDHHREPPHGGANADYVAWVKATPGVDATRVWVYPQHMGGSTVGITFVCDGRDDPIPTQDDIDAVAAHLDEHLAASGLKTGAPVGADVWVFAPIAKPLDPTIQITPFTAEVQQAVQEELADLLAREAEPGHFELTGPGTPMIRGLEAAARRASDHGWTGWAAEILAVIATVPEAPTSTLVQGQVLKSHLDAAISGADGEEDHLLVLPAANVHPAEGEIIVLGTVTFEVMP